MKNRVVTLIFSGLMISGLFIGCSLFEGKEYQESLEWGSFFESAGYDGTFVVLNAETRERIVYNPVRAKERMRPASTFKIPMTLIGLESGTVRDSETLLPYGGGKQPYPTWEHDMGLREAFKVSCVPIYKEVARRVGNERLSRALKDFRYGNQNIGSGVGNMAVTGPFWLNGSLKISAWEMVDFLDRMLSGKLPVNKKNLAELESIALFESTPGYRLYAKTGMSQPNDVGPILGWYVGWVRREDGLWLFALNMTLRSYDELPLRIEISRQCLKALGILDQDSKMSLSSSGER